MATATQLMPSPSLKSAFSSYTDSPNSPTPFASAFPTSNRSSGQAISDTLFPPPSPYPAHVDPSPVDSNGTNTTEIEEDAQEDSDSDELMDDTKSPDMEIVSPDSHSSMEMLSKIDTSIPLRMRSNSDEQPQSVIHAPVGFKQFGPKKSPPIGNVTSPSEETDKSDATVVSPTTPESNMIPDAKPTSGIYTSPLDTSIATTKPFDRPTPRAQTRQEAEEEWKRRSRASSSLEDIAEADDGERPEPYAVTDVSPETATMGQALESLNHAEQEITALKTALSECWTLCNTLAGLSSNHRQRIFSFSDKQEVQEQAWRSCWRLCQKLYETRDEDSSEVGPTLELCREFCQALFEARHRGDEVADSVLRVSFELNNHLYNTHDRNLPEAFRERTLDFYLTLCHRLMKQRTSLPEETDSLLRACWSLAEMLFSLRQNSREGKPPDEELLGSAVQACWELCDLFREGWTQIRPERGTPRPSQYGFPSSASQPPRSERASTVSGTYRSAKSIPPETPTTIFDDSAELSPDEPNIPNILILGPEGGATRTHNRWSSSASTLSGYTESSQHTSSTATAGREDPNLLRLKCLILKAAMNAGYTRSLSQALPEFVKSLPSNSFGTLQWQLQLLQSYKRLVLADPTLRNPATLPSRRYNAAEVARAVQWMGRSEQFGWLRDLYRLVFGFLPEDSTGRTNVNIQT